MHIMLLDRKGWTKWTAWSWTITEFFFFPKTVFLFIVRNLRHTITVPSIPLPVKNKKEKTMKKLLCCLGTFLMAFNSLIAAPDMINCKCQKCTCTQEKHCGCLSKPASQSSKSSETCLCGNNCSCGSNCDCK